MVFLIQKPFNVYGLTTGNGIGFNNDCFVCGIKKNSINVLISMIMTGNLIEP